MKLDKKLDAMFAGRNRIKEENFTRIKDLTSAFSKDLMIESHQRANCLKASVDQLVGKFETGEHDQELPEVLNTARHLNSSRVSYR